MNTPISKVSPLPAMSRKEADRQAKHSLALEGLTMSDESEAPAQAGRRWRND